MKPKLVALAIAGAATILAGCGSTKVVNHTETLVQTTTAVRMITHRVRSYATTRTVRVVRTHTLPAVTVTAKAAAAKPSGGFASTYPASFENSFAEQCTTTGGDQTACGCVLRHIEQAVPYSAVVAQDHNIVTGNPPAWYTAAQTACAGE